jgi:hypothetical protein
MSACHIGEDERILWIGLALTSVKLACARHRQPMQVADPHLGLPAQQPQQQRRGPARLIDHQHRLVLVRPKRPVCAVQPHRWPLVSGRSPSPRHPPPGRSDHSSRCRHQERCLRPLRPPAVPWSSGRQRPTRIHATRAVLGMLLSRDRGPPVALGGNTPRIINDTGTPSCRARRPDDQADRLRSPRQKVTGYER